MFPPLAKKCFKSEAYARLVALDWLAAMKRSAVVEKPSKAAFGRVGDWFSLVVVVELRVAVAPAFLVEILVILKGFLDSGNSVLTLPEVETKYFRNHWAHRRV